MKCEHEGCLKEATYTIEIRKLGEPVYRGGKKIPALCDEHSAFLLREKADEVEGVKECPDCNGMGGMCCDCHGTGKVPR